MSGATVRVPLEEAKEMAQALADALSPYCFRIEIAGSIRRRKADCGDIDLVCEPILEPVTDMFGEPTFEMRDQLDARLTRMADRGIIKKRLDANGRSSWGKSLKRAVYREVAVDIQSVHDTDTWGSWLLIRTGPAEFNKALVTERRHGGLLPAGFKFQDGFQLWKWGERIPTPTERSVFEALGLEYREPWERSA